MKTLALCLSALSVASAEVVFGLHRIQSYDGTELTANTYAPKDITTPLPLVVMINSWAMPGVEYIWPSRQMAENNYIAVEYEARGFYTSGGMIGTGGPDDIRDHAEVITWAMKKWGDKLNVSAIATGGISYGAGISLMATANDSRITACFAMSGWASLIDALWWSESPSLFWTYALTIAGNMTGREPEIMTEMLNNVMEHKNIPETLAWAGARSPITYIDQINARNVPVLMSNQFEDNMFHSNFQLDYWKKLTGPKKLFLAQGTHAEADGTGLFPVDNYIWDATYEWLDRFLKGVQNKVEEMPIVEVSLSDHHNPLIPGKPVYTRSTYSTWPPINEDEDYRVLQYTILSRNETGAGSTFGKLVTKQDYVPTKGDLITYTNKTELSVGIPAAGAAERPLYIHSIDILKLNAEYELAFLTDPLPATTRVCGNFNLTGLQATTLQDSFQVMGYLWSVQPKNFFGAQKAAILTHGPLNVYSVPTPGQPMTVPTLTFHAGCRDIKAGESLMLGLNMHNSLYKGANDAASLQVKFDYSTATLNVESVRVV